MLRSLCQRACRPLSSPGGLGATGDWTTTIHFTINETPFTLPTTDIEPDKTLASFLREDLFLTGTKVMCGQGVCGSCAVLMVDGFSEEEEGLSPKVVDSCLMPLIQIDGCSIYTSDYESSEVMRIVRDHLWEENGVQCGYCAPGVVMGVTGSLMEDEKSLEDLLRLENLLNSNQCRCTGYRPILEALKGVTSEVASLPTSDIWSEFTTEGLEKGYTGARLLELKGGISWLRPADLDELGGLWDEVGGEKGTCIVGGAIEVLMAPSKGASEKSAEKKGKVTHYVDVGRVAEMKQLYEMPTEGLVVGAGVSMHDLFRLSEKKVLEDSIYRTLHICLNRAGSRQVRTQATVGGNLFNREFVPELRLAMASMGAIARVLGSDGELTELGVDSDWEELRSGKYVLIDLVVPFASSPGVLPAYYKTSMRRYVDAPIVSAAFNVDVDDDGRPESLYMGFGGVLEEKDAIFVPEKTIHGLIGTTWNESALREALVSLGSELRSVEKELPPTRRKYRQTLVLSHFLKYFKLFQKRFDPAELDARDSTLFGDFEKREPLRTRVDFDEVLVGHGMHGKAEGNIKSRLLSTGDAQFVDDVSPRADELQVHILTSPVPHGTITKLDGTAALAMEGVEAVITADDIYALGGANLFGPTGIFDEEILASETVQAVGQPVALIVATSVELAEEAAAKVELEIDALPHLLTIDDAIEARSFMDFYPRLKKGDFKEGVSDSEFVHDGTFEIGGQDHQYGELHCSVVMPEDGDEFVVLVASQDLAGCQKHITMNLGIPQHKVIVKTKRMGGGFGGKQARGGYFGVLNALAAKVTGRSTRLKLDRATDMKISGGRHPYLANYTVGYDSDGTINALMLDMFNNGGYCTELTWAIMDKAILCADHCYEIPNSVISAFCCRTNLVTNTAFRGFGGPQAQMIMEYIVEDVATRLGVDASVVRSKNLYQEGDVTPCGVVLDDNQLPRCWEEIAEMSEYDTRLAEVEKFNEESKYVKRGLHMMPAKVGMGYCDAPFLNWGSALVHAYGDGTVLVSVGGTEMGQGLFTKVAQVVANTFEIPVEKVNVIETATDKVPNQPPTAASIGSDAFCGAAENASLQIVERLAALKEELGYVSYDAGVKAAGDENDETISWEGLMFEASLLRKLNLSAQGYYEMKEIIPIEWTHDDRYLDDWESEGVHHGDPFPYLIYGAVATEVEVDCLTGEWKVLRADMIEDVGTSINPLIDIGQVEGAFVQGMGWVTMEDVLIGSDEVDFVEEGHYYTDSMFKYVIPLAHDAPNEFNVALLKEAPCATGYMSSKTSGEPPFFMGSSVFFAIRNAVLDYRRRECGVEDDTSLVLNSPATVEKIRMACPDEVMAQVLMDVDEEELISFNAKTFI